MTEHVHPSEQLEDPPPKSLASQQFYAGAERRLTLWMPLLALPISLALMVYSKAAFLGFLVGSIVAYLNLRWLHKSSQRSVSALADAASTAAVGRLSGISLAFGTVLRLALVTGVGYVIFRHSVGSLYGYVGGLGISMLAMVAEALYEAWVAVRRGL